MSVVLGDCVQVSVVGSPTHPCGIHESAGAVLPPLGPTPKGGTRPALGRVDRHRVTGTRAHIKSHKSKCSLSCCQYGRARRPGWITGIPVASPRGHMAGAGHREAAAAQGGQLPAGLGNPKSIRTRQSLVGRQDLAG